jgi:hypothetical protein
MRGNIKTLPSLKRDDFRTFSDKDRQKSMPPASFAIHH